LRYIQPTSTYRCYRENILGHEEIERIEREREKAQKQKVGRVRLRQICHVESTAVETILPIPLLHRQQFWRPTNS